VHGSPQLVGAQGELVEFADGEGWALVGGEHWKVRGSAALRPGAPVRVVRVLGSSTLEIEGIAEGA
jgi:membrane-bound serine protease (ClpP class)